MDLADPEIIEAGPMTFVGFSFFGDPFQLSGGWTEENEIGRLWSRFMAYFANHHADIKHVKTKKVRNRIAGYLVGLIKIGIARAEAEALEPGEEVTDDMEM